ncbi:MAG TPA: type II toxin-antitoxin system VapC family toxin [Chthoniobacterales bacterium]|jgi:PIN domain nuclease of toxin-antitoxin system|nr:type II toxin-antitoxin system VapC family toxin [Chthoniobacterales bacterium]
MRYLFDTHAWYWAMTEPERFPARSRRLLKTAPEQPIGLSTISVWELCKMVESGRVRLDLPLLDWIGASLDPTFVELMPLSPQIAAASVQLPGKFRADPADQIIVATARWANAVIITKDRTLRAYPHVETIWD